MMTRIDIAGDRCMVLMLVTVRQVDIDVRRSCKGIENRRIDLRRMEGERPISPEVEVGEETFVLYYLADINVLPSFNFSPQQLRYLSLS